MFNNIGGKIKVLAQVLCGMGIGVSLIIGAVMMSRGGAAFLIGLLYVILGSLFSWIGSFILYGFGQLVENSDILVAEKKKRENMNGQEDVKENINQDGMKIEKMRSLKRWKEDGFITEKEYEEALKNL